MKHQPTLTPETQRLSELRQELCQTGRALQRAYAKFNFVTEPDLIEASIYDINALKSRYDYLLRRLKVFSGQSLRPESAPAPSAQPACIPAAGMEGGEQCPL